MISQQTIVQCSFQSKRICDLSSMDFVTGRTRKYAVYFPKYKDRAKNELTLDADCHSGVHQKYMNSPDR